MGDAVNTFRSRTRATRVCPCIRKPRSHPWTEPGPRRERGGTRPERPRASGNEKTWARSSSRKHNRPGQIGQAWDMHALFRTVGRRHLSCIGVWTFAAPLVALFAQLLPLPGLSPPLLRLTWKLHPHSVTSAAWKEDLNSEPTIRLASCIRLSYAFARVHTITECNLTI